MIVSNQTQSPQPRPNEANTCAVIVTFHPDERFVFLLHRVTSQFPAIFIIDNGSSPAALEMLQREDSQPKITLISNPTNRGIAAALNQGTRQARIANFDWAVTFDQDTEIYPGFLTKMLDVFDKSGGGNIIIGSNYDESHKSRKITKHRLDDADLIAKERKTLITSGTLIPLDIFDRIGAFREDYFIDSVDHEFSLRAREHGYRLLMSRQPFMQHSIGNAVDRQRNFRLLLSYHHPPKRKYYISRNTVFTAIHYFSREPAWSIRQGWRMLSDLASIILLEDDKARKLRAFLTGMAHGIKGKMGPIEETWPNGTY